MKAMVCAALLLVLAGAVRAAELDWRRFQDARVIEVLTHDEDGALRETSVWIVSFDGHGYVRTNDSRWLANIRRGSSVALRLGGDEFAIAAREPNDAAIAAREPNDAAIAARVEEGFKQKYGFAQRMMSAIRFREPTVLELTAR